MTSSAQQRFTKLLGHEFADSTLLEQALTHRSVAGFNNERLEFLGDAVLNFVVAENLFTRDLSATEGRLTRLRATLVRRETLASLARDLELGECLRLGSGELKSGGRSRDSILADALEAVVGAVLVDAGFEAARALVRRLIAAKLDAVLQGATVKDPKTRLQEQLQSDGRPLPDYRVVDVEGAAHAQRFTVECVVEGLGNPARGIGRSRRKAEQAAAARAIEQLSASASGRGAAK